MNIPSNNNQRWILILVVAIIAISVTCVLPITFGFIGAVTDDLDLPSWGESLLGFFTFALSCFPFIAIPGALVGYFLYRQASRARFGKPEMTVPQAARVGDPVVVQYRHTFNRNVTCDLFSVQLIFEERATYQQGSSTRTVAHEQVLGEVSVPSRSFQAGEMIADTLQWQIPREAMHTLKAPRNILRWLVRIKFVIPKSPDYVDEYEINVLPEIAA